MKDLVNLASTISQTFHSHQKYGTEGYFEYHIQGVVNSIKAHGLSDSHIIVAYLHDVVEDTSITIETIYDLFGTSIGDAVKAITKKEEETRTEYLANCAKNKIARIVKLHDALFNATNCMKNKNTQKYNYYLDTISQLKAV